MPTYTGIPIQLLVSTVSSPPVNPIDVNTGLPPAQWRSNAVTYNVGIFDGNGSSVDLSNLAYLQLTIASSQNAPANLITATVLRGSITPTITLAGFQQGIAQNAAFILTASQTDVSLGAQPYQAYWIQLSGVTLSGSLIVYGAGYVNFYNNGSATPAPIAGVVDFNAQSIASGNGTILPQTNLHTEIVTVTGTGSETINLVLSPPAVGGYVAGARVDTNLILPAVSGIMVNLLDQSLGGANVGSVLTDGYVRSAIIRSVWNGTNYINSQVSIPAY